LKLGKIQRARLDLAKVVRAKIRLKHALRADDEVRDVLPDALKAFDAKVQQARLKGKEPFDAAKVLTEIGTVLDRKFDGE
jgi:cytochrome c556